VLASKQQPKRVKSPSTAGLPFQIRSYLAVSLPQHNKKINDQFKIVSDCMHNMQFMTA